MTNDRDVLDPARLLIAQESNLVWNDIYYYWMIYADRRSSRKKVGTVYKPL